MRWFTVIAVLVVSVGLTGSRVFGQHALLAQQALQTSAEPTTKPSEPAAATSNQTFSFPQIFANTRLGKLAQGQQVSLTELKDPAFWIDTIRDLIIALVGFIPRIFVALLFVLVFWVIYRAIRRILIGSMKRAHVDPSIRDMLGHLIKWTIMGFGLVIAFNQIGIQIAALLTGVSIIGLAIGFAAQETLANFIAGIVIFWDRPFKVGDWIEIHEVFGQVQRVTFRSTRILDGDGNATILPNTHMLSSKLSNHSTHPLTRISVPIGIAYRESIDEAREALLVLTETDARIAKDPAAIVVVQACADSSVNLLLRFWINDESSELTIKHEYIEKAKNALDAAGISIPFPHLQLFMEETPALDKLTNVTLRKAG